MDVFVPRCTINDVCTLELVDATEQSEVCRLYGTKKMSQGFSSGKKEIKIFSLNDLVEGIRVAPRHSVQLSDGQKTIFSVQNKADESSALNLPKIVGAKFVESVRIDGAESLEVGVEDVLLDRRMRTIKNDIPTRVKCDRWKTRFGGDIPHVIIERKKKQSVHIPNQIMSVEKPNDAILSRPTSDFVEGFGLPKSIENICQDMSLGTTFLLLFIFVVALSAIFGYIQRCKMAVAMANANAQRVKSNAETVINKDLTEQLGEVNSSTL
jgi:hypothetical protein